MAAQKKTSKKAIFPARVKPRFVLKLPYPPSINSYYGKTRTGKVFIQAEGVLFRQVVVEALREIPDSNSTLDASHRLQVWVEAHMPDKRKRDLDNIKKALLDALKHAGVYADDSLIDDLRCIRCPPGDHKGFVRVYVSILGD